MSAAIVAMNAADARALTDRIKAGVEAIWELIKQAYTERAWAALGYESWDDYCTREFGTARLRLPREERAEVVASLRESGLSQRAIASATGLNQSTISRDLSRGDANASPEPDPKPVDAEVVDDTESAPCIHCGQTLPLSHLYEGGAGYECDPCVSPDEPELPPLPENYMNLGPEKPEPAPTPTPKPVIGIDGKTYNPKPATPKEPRRKPITDAFDSANFELRRAVERVVRLCEDDRLEKNKDQIVGANLSDLIRARDTLTRVIQHLKG